MKSRNDRPHEGGGGGGGERSKTMKRNMQRLGGGRGGLSLEAFANAKSKNNAYNPALLILSRVIPSYGSVDKPKEPSTQKKYREFKPLDIIAIEGNDSDFDDIEQRLGEYSKVLEKQGKAPVELIKLISGEERETVYSIERRYTILAKRLGELCTFDFHFNSSEKIGTQILHFLPFDGGKCA